MLIFSYTGFASYFYETHFNSKAPIDFILLLMILLLP